MNLLLRRLEIISVFALMALAFFLRGYALHRDLVFVHEQGRDALEVQNILKGKLTLNGPTTGLEGVFLGPFYYYLLAPLYFIGNGDPMVAAYFLVFLHSILVGFIYVFGKRIGGRKVGAMAAILYCLSITQIGFARWLSNPVPLPLFALIMFYIVSKVLVKNRLVGYIWIGILLGICMQLETTNALFFVPTLFIIIVTEHIRTYYSYRRKRLTIPQSMLFTVSRLLFLSLGFVFMLIPQLIFEVKHGLSTHKLLMSFQAQNSVHISSALIPRARLLYSLYANAWFPHYTIFFGLFIIIVMLLAVSSWKHVQSIQGLRITFWWFLIPTLFDLLYTGNNGNFWDYYIISEHVAFYLLIASILIISWHRLKKARIFLGLVICVYLILFFYSNLYLWKGYLVADDQRISLLEQENAIFWIYSKTLGQQFGFYAYTPTYQDDAYRYLFSYLGNQSHIFAQLHPEHSRYMFLVVEDDTIHLSRQYSWVKEQELIGRQIDSQRFGGITVYQVERK